MSKTHYEVLGVNELAGGAKIKRHYYELCKKFHPDISGGDQQKMIDINEAYRVLSDPTLKSAYDRELAAERREAAFAQAAETAASHNTSWQDVAPQPTTSSHQFTRAAQTARTQKKSGWALFMALGSAVAIIIIAISYAMPVPKAASAATNTPTVATTDTSAEPPTSASTSSNAASDKAAQDALSTLQSDTTQPPSDTPAPQPTAPTTPTQPTHKHRHPISFWYPQSND